MNRLLIAACFLAAGMVLTSCDDSGTNPPTLSIPTEYPGEDFAVNADSQLILVDQMLNLTAVMQQGRTGSVVSHADMLVAFGPLRDKTTNGFIAQADIHMDQLAKASGGTMDPMLPPSQNGMGGVFGGYLFDENGIELQQLVEKGLYSALAYNEMIQIMKSSDLSIAQLDGCVAIFGATPTFANSDQAAVNPDRLSAKYAARRDQNDGNGPYTGFRDGALLAHGAITAGETYQTRQREGLAEMRYFWERAVMATVANYLYATIDKLSQTEVSDQDRADAMHAFSEAVGFVMGWQDLENNVSVITPSKVDELLAILRTPITGVWTSYLFWQDPARTLPELQQALSMIQTTYNFTNQEMESFRFNWVQVQGR